MPERLKRVHTMSNSPAMKENMAAPHVWEYEFQDKAIIPVGKSSKGQSHLSSWLQEWDLIQD